MKKFLLISLISILAGCKIISLDKGSMLDINVANHVYKGSKFVRADKLEVYEVKFSSEEQPTPLYGMQIQYPLTFDENNVPVQQFDLLIRPEYVSEIKARLELKLTQESETDSFIPSMSEMKAGAAIRLHFIKGKRFISAMGGGTDFMFDENSVNELITVLKRVEALNNKKV